VFDKILIENLQEGCFARYAERIKLLIITTLFAATYIFNSYILYNEYANNYEELVHQKEILKTARDFIMTVQMIYCGYFFVLCVVYIKKAMSGFVPVNTSNNLLYISSIIVFIFTAFNVIKDDMQIADQTTLEYLAFHGMLSGYVIMLAYLYMPVDNASNQEIEFEMRKEQDKIFREVYGEEEEEGKRDEERPKSHDAEHKKKKIMGKNSKESRR